MKEYKYTPYFENEVLRKRPYLKREWCIRVIENPAKSEPQEHNRMRFWGTVPELGNRCLSRQRLQTMKLKYYADTDSLYIDLSEKPSTESRVVSEGIVLDYDAQGNLVGIDIDNASKKVQLKELTLSKLPSEVRTVAA